MTIEVVSGDQVELYPIDKLIPYENNAKIHTPEQIEDLMSSIKERGFNTVMSVDEDGVIITGHGRRLAAMGLKMKFVPVVVRKGYTESQIMAERLADNQVVGTTYDMEKIQIDLEAISDAGDVDMSSMGYDDRELDFLTDDLADMDMSAVIDDLDKEVTEQTERTDAMTEAVEEETVPVHDALGFKRVSIATSRSISKFMGLIEQQTELQGEAAFSSFVSSLIEEN